VKSKEERLIGGHVSTSGGLYVSVLNAEAIGVNAMQIFGSSPRMWYARIPKENEIKTYKAHLAKSGIKAVYLHAAYLVNLASTSQDIYRKSVKSLIDHLTIAEAIGANGLIFHVGSSKGMDRKKAFKQQVDGMKEILRIVSGKSQLIMENTAGGGDKIGGTVDELADLFCQVNSQRVKICFDTAHALESGMIEKYTQKNIKNLFDEFDKKIGVENIVVIHANDSKTEYNSHYDRHENVGEGYIGMRGFIELAKEKRLARAAWILEVPGFAGEGPDKKNVDILRSLF